MANRMQHLCQRSSATADDYNDHRFGLGERLNEDEHKGGLGTPVGPLRQNEMAMVRLKPHAALRRPVRLFIGTQDLGGRRDPEQVQAFADGHSVGLTPREFEVLLVLARAPGRPLGEIISSNADEHYREHIEQIEAWRRGRAS